MMPALLTRSSADALNASCFCIGPERERLEAVAAGHMFADVPSYVTQADMQAMRATVAAVEAAARLPGFAARALAAADPVALTDHGPAGVFMGYDFHIGPDGPRLIEINTNAGGAALNAALLEAQRACCDEVASRIVLPEAPRFAMRLAAMFATEWARQRGPGQSFTVAIVDDAPETQYLYPEFLLIARMLEGEGIRAVVADAAELKLKDGRLYGGDVAVDLVYNRLTDFMLADPRHRALREAYAAGAVVVTPNPHVYALLADKRNLVALSDPETLRHDGLEHEHAEALAMVPRTVMVTPDTADDLWAARRTLFFKPTSGHGSKAVYRGDKLTRGVWAEVSRGGYVAQQMVPPGERNVRVDGALIACKMDVRLYTYAGELLLAAARLYRGQTTNFRTKGGGFSPVYVV